MELENIHSEADITGEVARNLRVSLGLPQHKFWKAVGVSQSAGCRFENGRGEEIVPPVRILLFARYVAGLPIDASTPDGVKHLKRLAQVATRRSEKKSKAM